MLWLQNFSLYDAAEHGQMKMRLLMGGERRERMGDQSSSFCIYFLKSEIILHLSSCPLPHTKSCQFYLPKSPPSHPLLSITSRRWSPSSVPSPMHSSLLQVLLLQSNLHHSPNGPKTLKSNHLSCFNSFPLTSRSSPRPPSPQKECSKQSQNK